MLIMQKLKSQVSAASWPNVSPFHHSLEQLHNNANAENDDDDDEDELVDVDVDDNDDDEVDSEAENDSK